MTHTSYDGRLGRAKYLRVVSYEIDTTTRGARVRRTQDLSANALAAWTISLNFSRRSRLGIENNF